MSKTSEAGTSGTSGGENPNPTGSKEERRKAELAEMIQSAIESYFKAVVDPLKRSGGDPGEGASKASGARFSFVNQESGEPSSFTYDELVASVQRSSLDSENSRTLSKMFQTKQLIEAPILGNKVFTNTKQVKELKELIKASSLEVEKDPSGTSLRSLLTMAKSAIQDSQLSQDSAYNFLISLMPQESRDYLSVNRDLGTPFKSIWQSLQLSQVGDTSSMSIRKQIENLISTPPKSLGSTLRQIHVLNYNLALNLNLDKEEHETAVSVSARSDLLRLVNVHYPFQYASIESSYNELKKRAEEMPGKVFHPVSSLIDLISTQCQHISAGVGNSSKAKFEVRSMEVESVKEQTIAVESSQVRRDYSTRGQNLQSNFRAPKSCHLCGLNHLWKMCRIYSDKRFDLNFTCRQCGGHHLAACLRPSGQNGQSFQRGFNAPNQFQRPYMGAQNSNGQFQRPPPMAGNFQTRPRIPFVAQPGSNSAARPDQNRF